MRRLRHMVGGLKVIDCKFTICRSGVDELAFIDSQIDS